MIIFGGVGERGVPELVQRPRPTRQVTRRRGEQFGGATVGQSSFPRAGVEVAGGQRHTCLPVGEEQRPAAAVAEEAGQEPSGAGATDDDVRGAALAADSGTAVVDVELVDVEGKDFLGAGGGLVQHPPQRALAQRQPRSG